MSTRRVVAVTPGFPDEGRRKPPGPNNFIVEIVAGSKLAVSIGVVLSEFPIAGGLA